MGPRSWWLPTITALIFASLFAWSVRDRNTLWAVIDAALFGVNAFVALRLKRLGNGSR